MVLIVSAVVYGALLLLWGGGQHSYYVDASCLSAELHALDTETGTWFPIRYLLDVLLISSIMAFLCL